MSTERNPPLYEGIICGTRAGGKGGKMVADLLVLQADVNKTADDFEDTLRESRENMEVSAHIPPMTYNLFFLHPPSPPCWEEHLKEA